MSIEKLWLHIEDNIAKYEMSIIAVPGETGSFAYSIGLTELEWPELIVKGLPPVIAHQLITSVFVFCKDRGEPPRIGEEIGEVSTMPIIFREVTDCELVEYLCQSIFRQERLHKPAPRALQILWPDVNGRYPSDPQCDLWVATLQQMFLEGEDTAH